MEIYVSHVCLTYVSDKCKDVAPLSDGIYSLTGSLTTDPVRHSVSAFQEICAVISPNVNV